MTTDSAARPTDPSQVEPPQRSLVQRLRLDKYSALYLWAAFMIVFGLTQSQFLTATSIKLVLTERAIIAMLALAFLVPLIADTFDLSIGVMMGFSIAITTALAQNTDMPQVLNAVLALAACGAVALSAHPQAIELARANGLLRRISGAHIFYMSI